MKPLPQNRVFRLLILTESATKDTAATIARVQRLEMLTGGADCCVLFLQRAIGLSGPGPSKGRAELPTHPLQAFHDLHMLFLESGILVPFLPSASPTAFLEALQLFTLAEPTHPQLVPRPDVPNPATDILPYCTSRSVMTEPTFVAVSDVAASLHGLAAEMQQPHAQQSLMFRGVPQDEAAECVEFWSGEYLSR